MRKFILKVMVMLIIIAIPICLVNAIVDPAGLFVNSRQTKDVVKLLTDGKTVVGNLNLNERQLQKDFIQEIITVPDAIVIGSSRAMNFTEELAKKKFSCSYMLNHGMSGAGIFDYCGVLGSYLAYKKELPSHIIISVDSFVFNKNNGEVRYKDLSREINYFLSEMGFDREKVKDYVQADYMLTLEEIYQTKVIFSLQYFQAAVSQMDDYFNQPIQYYVVESEKDTEGAIRRYDGSTRHSKEDYSKDEKEVSEYVKKQIDDGNLYQLTGYEKMDPVLCELFEKMIVYLQHNECEVIFLLAPYHPEYYEYFCDNEEYSVTLEVEKYLLEFAKENDIPVWGSYSPYAVGLEKEDFMDGIHVRDYNFPRTLVKRE